MIVVTLRCIFVARLAACLLLLGAPLTSEVVQSYSTISPCGDDPVFCFGESGECKGLVNTKGEVIRRFHRPFKIRGPFREGLLAVMAPGKKRFGYIDTRGRWAIKPVFEDAGPFSNGLARVCENGRCGFIDKSGEVAIPLRFSEVEDFDQDGYARFYIGEVWDDPDRRVGVMDTQGEVVIEPTLFAVTEFSNGVAAAVLTGPCWQEKTTAFDSSDYFDLFGGTSDQYSKHMYEGAESGIPHCRWALIDRTGQRVSEAQFLDVGEFVDGLALVRVGKTWGYVDTQGRFVIRPKPSRTIAHVWVYRPFAARPFSEGLAAVYSAKQGWTYIDRQGSTVFATQYNWAKGFKGGLARVFDSKTKLAHFITKTSDLAFPAGYESASDFCHGVAEVSFGEDEDGFYRSAFIDTEGKVLFAWQVY